MESTPKQNRNEAITGGLTNGLDVVAPVCRETEAVAMPWFKTAS